MSNQHGTLDALCRIPHPLTPRDKVARAIQAHDNDHVPDGYANGLSDEVSDWSAYLADRVLTALASGSGDHAELARLKAAMSKSNDEICQSLGKALGYPWFKDDQRNFPGATEGNGVCVGDHVAESIADEAASRISAILAENAALRGERDEAAQVIEAEREDRELVESRLTARATEAERKLAEAVGLLEEILPPVLCGESWGLPDDDVSHQRMSFGWIKKVRTFLSKEAERG